MSADPRLERLYDYTKFHLGVYLGFASGIVALIAAAAESDDSTDLIASLVEHPMVLAYSLVAMTVAGVSGAVVATTCVRVASFTEVWDEPCGPLKIELLKGETWAAIEHMSFWVSLLCLAISILWRA